MRPLDDSLSRATGVLRRNWTGSYTVPASGLYPHQWSWDSAFIAIGLRHLSPQRAQQELNSLLSGQWSDGRIPQIIYNTQRDDDYAPSAQFWRSSTIPGSPAVPTSGLIQPPVHAWAVWLVHSHDPSESQSRHFLERAYPSLVAWHRYLRERRCSETGLAAIVHPWESGTDNSPLWDDALERVPGLPQSPLERPDLRHAAASERPSKTEYGKYFWLAERYRDHGCCDTDDAHPFLMEDPTTNALWARSELALAEIAEALGMDGAVHRQEAVRITQAMDGLWCSHVGTFSARDRHTGSVVPKATVGGLLPLILPPGVLGQARADALLGTLRGEKFLGLDGPNPSIMAPSYDATAADLDPELYWRGPAWFNMAWLLHVGLREHRAAALVETRLDEAIAIAAAEDFPEYLDPWTGKAHGTRNFSWTAAVVLDLLRQRDLEGA